ncbi:MAG: hypothetical protein AAF500_21705 [Myxococcota bacterium]
MQQSSAAAKTDDVGPRNWVAIVGTSKTLFFLAAGLSFLLSIWLWFSGDKERGLFVGLWVPSILSAGTLLLKGERDE